MKFVAIIPARYASTRFPAKPLAVLGGKTVIQRVFELASNVFEDVYIATDDKRIEDNVLSFGGNAIMTSKLHSSGTDRCYEAYTKTGRDYDVVVNIQGDEPFIQPSQLIMLKESFKDPSVQIATLIRQYNYDDALEQLADTNNTKVVIDKNRNVLYFSRSIIPYQRNVDPSHWLNASAYYKHVGLYAYKAEVLKEITGLPQSPLERAECLEQLRWLENGYKIKAIITDMETIGIDTPQDLQRAEQVLKKLSV